MKILEEKKSTINSPWMAYINTPIIQKSLKNEFRQDYRTDNKCMKHIVDWGKKDNNEYREIEKYYTTIANKIERIQVDKNKMGGMPVIENTRISVSLVAACLKDEMTFMEICEEYKLTREDIENAMEYVVEILDTPYQEG